MADEDLGVHARLAVLDAIHRAYPGSALAWPADRGQAPAALDAFAGDLVAAVAPLIRREAAEELAAAIDTIPQMLVDAGADPSRIGELYREGVRHAAQMARRVARADHTTTDQGGPDGRC